MYTYLLEFAQFIPGGKSKHYAGVSNDIARRMAEHRSGNGGPLFQIARNWGIEFEVVQTWEFSTADETFDFERWLKEMKQLPRFCPHCNGGRIYVPTGVHVGARARYAERLRKESQQRWWYQELRRNGVEHQRARDIARGRIAA